MATVHRRPVTGHRPPSHGLRAPLVRPDHLSLLRSDAWPGSAKPEEFIYYSDSDDDSNDQVNAPLACDWTSRSFVDYQLSSQTGLQRHDRLSLSSQHATKHLLTYCMLRERAIPMTNYNKVFCSAWLSDNQVVFGTKCNKILVYNLRTRRIDNIPMLLSRRVDPSAAAGGAVVAPPPDGKGGVYALALNPSRTLMASGARNCCHLAVYRLPTLDPVCVGEGGHSDWIYDAAWLDDQYVATGGRDTAVSLWRVPDPDTAEERRGRRAPTYTHMAPVASKNCKTADKVRSLAFNRRDQSLVALSLNAYVHLFDAETFKQKLSRRLPHCMDNVCLALGEESRLYAVGSKSHTTLLDPKSLKVLKKISAKYHGCGIRSLSFNGDILTIGTGNSVLMFYDLRAHKYLDSGVSSGRAVVFKATSGWVCPPAPLDDRSLADAAMGGGMGGMQNGAGGLVQVDHTPAIYTHCYDQSGTRLFTAGGPLSVDVRGCYAGLWM